MTDKIFSVVVPSATLSTPTELTGSQVDGKCIIFLFIHLNLSVIFPLIMSVINQ